MDLAFDKKHLWHPYTNLSDPAVVFPVVSADGVRLKLEDGRELIDGMSSWWACIHGYNVPELNQALQDQAAQMSHVMFGSLTHEPAIRLGKQLLALNDDALNQVFFADSGSVAVEAAMKMAAQYCYAKNQNKKKRFLTFTKGYHGDTFGAMSVCDPVNGMHTMFSKLINKHLFVDAPICAYGEEWQDDYLLEFEQTITEHHEELIAVIFEPIVQGVGGMWFYHPEYLRQVRTLCDRYGVLLIFDEIATGFGRTGEMFAYQHAGVVPDILCLGKAITGGYMTLSAVLCQEHIGHGMDNNFMHGPTFMANPLACAVASASIDLLINKDWHAEVKHLENQLFDELQACLSLSAVKTVRSLGAIGVVEMHDRVDTDTYVAAFVEQGVWIRPFSNLIYVMPPYIMPGEDVSHLCQSIYTVIKHITEELHS
ncbi:adenosylmethionine--8-amino-7-oxononanoate transaminase [Marinicella rhabdoformis]|uniref:adenosylmethionine--8-amino-7-oxononanoate transaminase n=1 Tax=Marinicella rhabdoformis TaxID=2580566 RepID=UPI0012AED814|nr:adenosylmethionine--8-amino-7-oxononanoate transaminase [Marinicella rhabdoformis]